MAGQLGVLNALDVAKTQMYHFTAIVIAGMGFFTDAYDLFCISLVTKLLGRIYYTDYTKPKPGVLPPGVQAGVTGVALVGTLAGQLFFGWLGDKLGRKKVYGMTLMLMVGCSLASGLSFGSSPKSVMASLCFFRFWLGFGIGGDYPLSATIMSEYANKKTRGAFIAAVFAMQGFGIMAGGIFALIVSTAFDHKYKVPTYEENPEASLVPAFDYVWRLILMFGAVPAALTYYWRMKMPETARYTALVAKNAPPPPSDNNNLFFLDELASNSDSDSDSDLIQQPLQHKFGPSDFQILKVIGQGAFGKVFMVRRKGDSNSSDADSIFAMKTKSKLYLILDFINGGHLFFQLCRQGIFSEDEARIYTAEIVSAVSHLHSKGIVHRDLKPENILMDSHGHVMLTDFGMSKEIEESERSNSMCGTTEYMAPEILLGKGHNKDADWWSVGVLLYEMITGKAPFTHNNRKKLQEKIIKEKIKLPPYLTGEAHSLLKGLLQKDPSTRLGSGPNGDEQIKNHKWFRTINWNKLEARELQPKFKPSDVSGKDCTANFDRCWTTMPLEDSPASTPTAGDHFQGYTYVAPNPWLSSR